MTEDEDGDPGSPEGPDYVGYKRPPKAYQFKKGRSGNPRGRRKGSKNFAALVREELGRQVQINVGAKRMSVCAARALLMRTLRDGIGGNRAAAIQALRLMERYCFFDEDDEEPTDLSLLNDEELEQLERLLTKCRGDPRKK
jgi:hypothetical protein